MTAASEIITLAYREANFKNSIGTPTPEEFSEGLTLLQSIMDSLFGIVVGTKLTAWHVPKPQRPFGAPSNYPALPDSLDVAHPPSNSRLVVRTQDDTTIYFPSCPDNGAVMEYVDAGHEGDIVLEANGALFGIVGSNESLLIPALYPAGRNPPRRWVFRADYASWVEVTNLQLASDMPLPTMFDDYFVTALAIRLSPRFGAEPRKVTLLRHREMSSLIRLEYLQTKEQIVNQDAAEFSRFDDGVV